MAAGAEVLKEGEEAAAVLQGEVEAVEIHLVAGEGEAVGTLQEVVAEAEGEGPQVGAEEAAEAIRQGAEVGEGAVILHHRPGSVITEKVAGRDSGHLDQSSRWLRSFPPSLSRLGVRIP